jgi:hypothetical protein
MIEDMLIQQFTMYRSGPLRMRLLCFQLHVGKIRRLRPC